MKTYTRTDLACESRAKITEPMEGIEESHRDCGFAQVDSLCIRTEEASKQIGREMGRYLTLSFDGFSSDREKANAIARLLAGELRGMAERLTGKQTGGNLSVLVAGLGNEELTADAVGPLTVKKLTATRHLKEEESELFQGLQCSSVCAIAPGTLGQTGMESTELLLGVVSRIHPDLLIAVDALAARSPERLATTVQISDVGIVPGSGVGNHRRAIDCATFGIPVICVGVPTVVNSATLVYDALEQAGIKAFDDDLVRVLETGKSFFVSPKESDLVSARASDMISRAIGIAFVGEDLLP